MNCRSSRRTFFKHFLTLSAFGGASILSLKRNMGAGIGKIGLIKKAHAIGNTDYAIDNLDGGIKIEYVGLSCFVITSSNGTKIITDPYIPDKEIFHSELRKEPADVITVSCGHYAHCHVYAVGGVPYIYKTTEPAELESIKFRGLSTRHLTMNEIETLDPGENIVMCFEVDGIKICHLGALGHKLSDEQVKQIGKVDILMVPVGGVSTLPVKEATEVCDRLRPKVIFPMNYRSERTPFFSSWALIEEFIKGKKNVIRCDEKVGSSEFEFASDNLPSETQIIVARCVY